MAKAQVINFPDDNFKAKLLAANASNTIAKNQSGNYFKIDANSDNEIEVAEALQVKELYLEHFGNTITRIGDLTGISNFENLYSLNCVNNKLVSLNVSMLENLVKLYANKNLLSSINVNGLANLEIMDLSANKFTSFNFTSSGLINLKEFDCGDNLLTSLNVTGLDNLEKFSCNRNNLLNALNISNLTNLYLLEVTSCNLTTLDLTGITQLTHLHAFNNNIASLDVSQLLNLKYLYVSSNNLTSLHVDNLINLIHLEFERNNINDFTYTTLPNVERIYCFDNNLTNINLTGLPKLRTFWCFNNLFTTLNISALPLLNEFHYGNPGLSPVTFGYRPLMKSYLFHGFNETQQSVFDFSQMPNLTAISINTSVAETLDLSPCKKLQTFYARNNLNLQRLNIKTGLPLEGGSTTNCPNLKYICANEMDVQRHFTTDNFFSNHQGYSYSSDMEFNSYCSFTPGGNYNTIKGQVTFDLDNNGCDTNDSSFGNFRIGINDGTTEGATYTNNTGNYSFYVQKPNIALTASVEHPQYFILTPATTSLNFPTNNNSVQTRNFCIKPNGIRPDLEVMLMPLDNPIPGFEATYRLIYKNKGNQVQSGAVSLTFNDDVLDFTNSTITPTVVLNTLSWNFVDLAPFEKRIIDVSFILNSPVVNPPLQANDILTYITSITSPQTDETPADNIFTLNETVVNSFDPNDKTCLEGTVISPEMVGNYVHYRIRFENTGTFAAQNVVVKDVIDATKFNLASLVPLDGSHPFTTRVTSTNNVEFIFENIQLPFDDANNDGYVLFKIKTKAMVAGDSFSNTASIYFDYNAPIVTEPAVTMVQVLGIEDFAFENYFVLHPNPVSDILYITTKQNVNVNTFSVYNILGQLIMTIPNATNIKKIDVSNLSSGNYFLKIISDRGTTSVKFIKK